MDIRTFDYKINDEKQIIRQLLYAIATFDLNSIVNTKNIEAVPEKMIASVTVVTPSQTVSAAFRYRSVEEAHMEFTDLLLSVIYPHHQKMAKYEGLNDEPNIYKVNSNNLYVISFDEYFVFFIQEPFNKYQYDQIKKYIDNLFNTPYFKNGGALVLEFPDGKIKSKKDLWERMAKLEKKITEKTIPEQYPVSELSFVSCQSDEEITAMIDEFIENQYGGR